MLHSHTSDHKTAWAATAYQAVGGGWASAGGGGCLRMAVWDGTVVGDGKCGMAVSLVMAGVACQRRQWRRECYGTMGGAVLDTMGVVELCIDMSWESHGNLIAVEANFFLIGPRHSSSTSGHPVSSCGNSCGTVFRRGMNRTEISSALTYGNVFGAEFADRTDGFLKGLVGDVPSHWHQLLFIIGPRRGP